MSALGANTSTPALPAAPSNRDEHWKYANLRALSRLRAQPAVAPTTEIIAAAARALPPALPQTPRLVLIDGFFVPSLSADVPALKIDAVRPPVDTPRLAAGATATADRYYALLNAQSRIQTALLKVAANTTLRLELICIAASDAHPAIALELADGAELTLIERHLALESANTAITNLHWHGRLAERAKMQVARLGHHGAKNHFIETIDLVLGAAAYAKVVAVTEGAASSRSTAFVSHAGGYSQLEWHAAALGEGTQIHDAFVQVDHAAAAARTSQVFRGIAAARSRIGFNGTMRVEAAALGTDTAQSLKGLIAGGEAEIDVRPQLEIYTDAVSASHGATVGKLDADMLFYLLSRGIPPEAAESLLKWAFISDVLIHLPCGTLRTQVESTLERQLPGASAARMGA